MSEETTIERIRRLAVPIADGLGLDLYDIELRSGTLRVTLDTPPDAEGGVTLDVLALATRLLSRDLDHDDPMPGRYTLEVTSPGLERSLRSSAHFQREVGKVVALRLRDTAGSERRVRGLLVAADGTAVSVRVDGSPPDVEPRVVPYDLIDRAHTVFEWGPTPKPGGPKPSAVRNRPTPNESATVKGAS